MGHNTDAFLSRPHNFSSSSSCVSIKGAGTGWWSRRDTLKRDAMHKKRKKEKSSQSSSSSSPGGITGFRVEEKKRKLLFFPKDLAASIFRYLCAFGLAAAEAIPNG
jgi:hypothetical protein